MTGKLTLAQVEWLMCDILRDAIAHLDVDKTTDQPYSLRIDDEVLGSNVEKMMDDADLIRWDGDAGYYRPTFQGIEWMASHVWARK